MAICSKCGQTGAVQGIISAQWFIRILKKQGWAYGKNIKCPKCNPKYIKQF
jgi:hypothetical protein